MRLRRAVRRFQAMGCRSVVVVDSVGTDCEALAERAMIGIARLEACWSPFLADSDVSRLNRAGGAAIVVRPAMVTLLQAMAEATVTTAGAYDPTVSGRRRGAPWIGDVAIDPQAGVVQAAAGTHVDPGGLGKGLAADLVVTEVLAAGAAGAVVFLGGDGRVASGDRHRRWPIDVASPDGTASVDRLELPDGAIATSGCRRDHLVDPTTGELHRPTDVVQVSVLAGTGATAEALAKAVLLDSTGNLAVRLDGQGVGVLAVHADGRTTANATWRRHRAGPSAEAAA